MQGSLAQAGNVRVGVSPAGSPSTGALGSLVLCFQRMTHAAPRPSLPGLTRQSILPKDVDARDEPGDECDREDAWSAGCKSPSHGVTPCVAEGNCVAESEVESNRKRTDSPQENKPDSAAWRGEPAHAWRSLEPTERADVTGKATFGPMTWLGVGCPEGKAS